MPQKSKCSSEQKLNAVLRCLQGKTSATYEAKQLGIRPQSDIVNITLHFFLKYVLPMLHSVKKHNTVVS